MLLQTQTGTELYDAIAFNIDPQCWPNPQVSRVRVAYTLDINEFRGRQSLQFMVRHVHALSE